MRANALFGAAISVWLMAPGAAQATTYTYSTIDFPGSTQTQAYGINDSDQIVGAYNVNDGFLFSNGVYSTFAPAGGLATGINDSGQVVGISFAGTFLDTNGSVTILSVPGTVSSGIPGINNLGQVVQSLSDTTSGADSNTYVFSNGIPTLVPALAGAYSTAINDAGDIVGFANGGCFLYANGTMSPINVPGGTCIWVSGINDSGQIVGSSSIGAFVDTNNVFTILAVPGEYNTDPLGINDLGQIVGQYQTAAAGGPPLGFLASPVPEPGSMALLASGLALLGALGSLRRRAWRRRFSWKSRVFIRVHPRSSVA
jgi:hypothetical protein